MKLRIGVETLTGEDAEMKSKTKTEMKPSANKTLCEHKIEDENWDEILGFGDEMLAEDEMLAPKYRNVSAKVSHRRIKEAKEFRSEWEEGSEWIVSAVTRRLFKTASIF